jgi:hypothetical protein
MLTVVAREFLQAARQVVQQQAAGVFSPEEITILAAAFDEAWDRLEKSDACYGSASAKERTRQQLGKAIICTKSAVDS